MRRADAGPVRLAQAPLRQQHEPQALEVAPGEGQRAAARRRVGARSVGVLLGAELRDLGGHVLARGLGLHGGLRVGLRARRAALARRAEAPRPRAAAARRAAPAAIP